MKHSGGVLEKLKTPVQILRRSERGVTGLETAIILIAFVVVASVFAFTVLSTGIFSAERGKDTVLAGLEQASGTMEMKGSVIANGVVDEVLSDADTEWQEIPAKASSTRDATDKKEGEYSGELTVAASQTGLLAYEIISPTVDLTSYDSISLWVKSSAATDAGDLQVRISDDAANCGTGGNSEDINIPALAADTWNAVSVGITSSTTRTAVACIGLVAGAAYSAQATVNFDYILAQGQVTSVVVVVANSIGGEPVDLTEPADSNADGIADSEDRRHKLIVGYSDARQRKNDLYWTKTFVGNSDSDDLLEAGERVELTVQLGGLASATPLIKSTQFTLEIAPPQGSVLAVQRTTPAKIDTVMNLQ